LNDSAAEAPLGEAEHPPRIAWERDLLATFAREHKPVLGVCYGMQLMNIHFGGSLFRDVAGEVAGALDHGGQGRSLEHEVTRSEDSVLLRDLPQRFLANSSHGQAVHEVAPGFAVSGRGSDGVIEAIENASERLFGVEWHPESDATGGPVYRRFVALIRG
jgi:putative glutamine amidotransferase